jgi:PEP-CTERM motif
MEKVRKPGAKWSAVVVAACFVAMLGIGTAQAASVIPGNNPEPNEQNVLLNTGATGTTIAGTLNQTGQQINFTGNVQLTAPSNGQARVEGGAGFTTVTIAPDSADATFQDLIANLNVPNAPGGPNGSTRTVDVTVNLLGGGTQAFDDLPLGNGENFFTVVAGPGEQLTSVEFQTSGTDITDVRQVRVSGFQDCPTCPPARVPEPGTLAVLGGSLLGFVGLVTRRLNRR